MALSSNYKNVVLLILLAQNFQLMLGLRLTGTVIPHYAILSKGTILECHFSLQDDSLYALKWYKDNHEFFRFKPTDDPPITVFPVLGVNVNKNQSSLNYVQLEPITLSSKGVYRCEISAEAPSFQTVYEDYHMRVMALPETGPSITGVLPWYNVGDNISAKCHVQKSFPSSKLTWFINDVLLDEEECNCISTETFETGKATDGTTFYSSTSHLKFQVDSNYFSDGSIIVVCKATFAKSKIVLTETLQSNIKAGLGLRQYAADSFSTAASFNFLSTASLTSILFRFTTLLLGPIGNRIIMD